MQVFDSNNNIGYKLEPFLIIPYKIKDDMSRIQKNFNYLHSSTRMRVEQAFGILKKRFAIYSTDLTWRDLKETGVLIGSTLIVHNWLIDLQDDSLQVQENYLEENFQEEIDPHLIDNEAGRRKRDDLAHYLWSIKI